MLFAIAVILLLIVDQALKYWVTLSIPLDEGVRVLFPGFLELRNIHNTGAAFSLFSDAPRWVFIILAVVFVIIVVVAIRRKWVSGAFGRWMAILLLAGALGNLLDRMLSGYVVDMFSFEFWPSFPVFNFADVCLVVGGIGFFLYALLHKEPEEEKKAPASKARKPRPEREPDVKEARRTEKKSASTPVQKEQPTQKMKAAQQKPQPAKPAAPKQEAPKAKAPTPAPKPAEPKPAPAAPEDPFAAWDKAVQTAEKEAEIQAAEAAKPAPPPEPKPSDVKPTVPRRPKPAESFSLDDILAEFKDE